MTTNKSTSRYGPTAAEQECLDEIYHGTGLLFRRIGGIDLRDESVMKAVLPIAASLFSGSDDPGVRAALLYLFTSRYAHQYTSRLIDWLECEGDPVVAGVLVNILASKKFTTAEAQRVWRHLQDRLDYVENGYRLAAAIVGHNSIRQSVQDRVLESLRSGKVSIGGRQDLAQAKDPVIQSELKNVESQQCVRLPRSFLWRKSDRGPNRVGEIASFEVDATDAQRTLESLAKVQAIDSIENIGVGEEFVIKNNWYVASANRYSDGHSVEVWIRCEDADVVELVVCDAPAKAGCLSSSIQ